MKPHKDLIRKGKRSKGHSLRMGKNVPENSASLAYMQTRPVSPEENLLLEDTSSQIQENGLPRYMEKEVLVFPNKEYLLQSEQGETEFPSDNIHLTDEFTIRRHAQDKSLPLYFRMECKGRFDARNSYVIPYKGGRNIEFTSSAVRYEEVNYNDQSDLLYIGDMIHVQEATTGLLPKENAVKIHLVRDSADYLYRIVLYTSFRGEAGKSYKVTYPHYENGKVKTREEVLNAYPFFEKVEYDALMASLANPTPEVLSKKEYAIVKSGKGYKVFAGSQVMIANMTTRPPQLFRYRTEAKLKAKLGDTNPGTLNIGVMYLNKSVFGIENLMGIGKMLNVHGLKPSYLSLANPHPKDPSWLPSDVRYWQADLDMPAHYYYDYDILILTGYGKNDLSAYRDYFEDFLSEGGTLWVDNAGEGNKSLSFLTEGQNTFLMNIGFSETEVESGSKRFVSEGGFRNRLYMLPENVTDIGYETVKNKITFGPGESLENWNKWMEWGTKGPAVIERPIFQKGSVILSNCGIFRSVYHGDELSLRFIYNTFLSIAENQWFASPWRYDYVYHRDNLFEQEYKDTVGNQIYIDDRHDLDPTQIVAKKQLGKTCKDMLLPHVKPWFQQSTGLYSPVIESDNEVLLENQDFESISVDDAGNPIESWTRSTDNAIPKWNTKIIAGTTVTFRQITNISSRGMKSVALEVANKTDGAQAFWESQELVLPADTYELKAWIKTVDVIGLKTEGAKIGMYLPDGNPLKVSVGVTESRNWMELTMAFTIPVSQRLRIRAGFIDGNGAGTMYLDNVSVINKGNIQITPQNDGNRMLYSYAVKPKGETIDISVQGFLEEDITRINPEIPYKLIIRSFVYKWQNLTRRYEREYGNTATYQFNLSKSEGKKTYGYLHSMLPPLKDGAEWQDKNRVYYELLAVGADGFLHPLVNVSLYDTEKGKEYYLKNGELVIGYMDLYWARLTPTILVQAQTMYETIRASRRQFGLKMTNNDKIYPELPETKDSRESWFLRVHNGGFLKSELGYQEWKGLSQNSSQLAIYEKRTIQQDVYKIPEYEEQVFHPYKGIRTVENQVEYITRKSVKVPHKQLFVEWGTVEREELKAIGGENKIFEATHERWDEREPVKVYVDPDGNGTYVEIDDGFDIDYEKGLIIFDETVVGKIQVSYAYRNLRLFKRTYGNGKIVNEILHTEDKKTYVSKRPFWLYEPAPILKKVANAQNAQEIISPVEYTINYEKGTVRFEKEQPRVIYADYGYYTQQEVDIEDYDVQNGILYLKNEIDFQDDLFASYSYEEEFFEYKGYYNEEVKQFLKLDLNPSVGHYSTLPITTYVNDKPVVTYRDMPSSKLLNKEIHVYIVPASMGGASIRHCFTALEWKKIQESNPMCLLLAKIYVREHTNLSQTIVMDSRKRGGGLQERITEKEISKRVKGRQRYWDIGSWNGKAYYRNGVLVVTIPKEVLLANGGNFTEEQVQAIVNKYIAYGVYTIIEYA